MENSNIVPEKEVSKINQEHRDGYFVMYEALSKGYLPCKKCLKGYSLVGK